MLRFQKGPKNAFNYVIKENLILDRVAKQISRTSSKNHTTTYNKHTTSPYKQVVDTHQMEAKEKEMIS